MDTDSNYTPSVDSDGSDSGEDSEADDSRRRTRNDTRNAASGEEKAALSGTLASVIHTEIPL